MLYQFPFKIDLVVWQRNNKQLLYDNENHMSKQQFYRHMHLGPFDS